MPAYFLYLYYTRAVLSTKFNAKKERSIPSIQKISLYMEIKQNTKHIHLKLLNFLFLISNKLPSILKYLNYDKLIILNSIFCKKYLFMLINNLRNYFYQFKANNLKLVLVNNRGELKQSNNLTFNFALNNHLMHCLKTVFYSKKLLFKLVIQLIWRFSTFTKIWNLFLLQILQTTV